MNFAHELKAKGLQGIELFNAVATHNINIKKAGRLNRCPVCWHDANLSCICASLPSIEAAPPLLPIKILILMHYKEYLNAGNDAKLLLALLADKHCELFIFGLEQDWQRFTQELSIDPSNTMLLWPCKSSITVDQYKALHPITTSFSSNSSTTINNESPPPTLRVVVLDGVYNNANSMFRSMRKRLPAHINPPAVALHPSSISIYHRAIKTYSKASDNLVKKSTQPKALRICTVEAVALLLVELGESTIVTDSIIQALRLNNKVLEDQTQIIQDVGTEGDMGDVGDMEKEEEEEEDNFDAHKKKTRNFGKTRKEMLEEDKKDLDDLKKMIWIPAACVAVLTVGVMWLVRNQTN